METNTTIQRVEMSDEEKAELLARSSLSAESLCVPKVYSPIFGDEYRYFILSSGRISGKTCILVALWWTSINKYPDRDCVFLQATTTEIKDSIINEIEKFLSNSGFTVGDDPSCEYYIPKKHDKIERRGYKGATYFYPITDSRGGQRSRGINTKHKLSLILYEEAQKNKDANVIEQSVITFIRQMDRNAKLVIVGNNETVGHWFVDYVKSKRLDPDWCYIYANYKDIWQLLNHQTQEYIENFKKTNYVEFRRVFLGDINASASDVVFPQFIRSRNYKKRYELEHHYIKFVIVGIDHATADDTFAVVPVAILDDGTTQTLEVFYDDPIERNRSLAPSEQCAMLEEFLDFLNERYQFEENYVPIILSVDAAAATFIKQLKMLKRTARNKAFWKEIKIKSFSYKKKYDVNLDMIKNAFAYNVLTILNEGAKMWNGEPNKHRLACEIEKQRYKNGKLDKHIPNDLCDALEYGLIPYYSNCYNITFPVRKSLVGQDKSHYEDIRRFARLI